MIKTTLILFLTFTISLAYSQPYKTIKAQKPYKWMVGVSWSVIDDDGRPFSGLFDIANSWNYMYYPTQISVDRYLKNGWSLEASATYTQYPSSHLINGVTGLSSTFLNVDVNGKYSFYNHLSLKMRWFEPYFTFGLGYTYRNNANADPHVPTVNLGYGMNFWVHKNVGIRLHSQAKFGVFPNVWATSSNYLQHSAGFVFRWNERKKSRGDFDKRRYKWMHGKERYKNNKGH